MNSCLFCAITAGEIPCEIVHQDEHFLAFRDIDPQAPVHILIIPRVHVDSLSRLGNDQASLAGPLLLLAAEIAAHEHIDVDGYRCVINTGTHGGQSVGHLHLHLLGGRQLAWPPG